MEEGESREKKLRNTTSLQCHGQINFCDWSFTVGLPHNHCELPYVPITSPALFSLARFEDASFSFFYLPSFLPTHVSHWLKDNVLG
jgi:hypothetical protein